MAVVTVAEAKTHLRVEHSEDDDYIRRLIAQCQAAAEDYCRVSFDASMPEPVRLAILMLVCHFYENRENADKQTYISVRMAFESLLYPYRDEAQMF